MAKSKFEYVKKFELDDRCLPNCWIVVRIDGHKFHKFSEDHKYEKPNEVKGLLLMNDCAKQVMREFHDIIISFGESDEYSFVFRRSTTQFSRRGSKLMTNIVSLFSSSFVFNWSKFFPDQPLAYPPTFDGRVILYPDRQNIRDYLSWRQADCHINNLYNTCFWMLVLKGGLSKVQAEQKLKGTLSSDKNEILFSEFSLNYNEENAMFRKGSCLIWDTFEEKVARTDANYKETGEIVTRERKKVVERYVDIIGEDFWKDHPKLLT